jgi:hypothetical protein
VSANRSRRRRRRWDQQARLPHLLFALAQRRSPGRRKGEHPATHLITT